MGVGSWITWFLLAQVSTPITESSITELRCPELDESSGVCVSQDEKIVWTHNDSGDSARIFGFTRSGQLAVTVAIDGVEARDWEDICSFSSSGKNYLAIGDIGNNGRERREVQIYIIQEPNIQDAQDKRLTATVACRLTVRFPEGAKNDCEALAYDPLKQVFVLSTKELLRSRLFEVAAQQLEGNREVEARWLQTVSLPSVTGADISPDGRRMVFSTYGPSCVIERDAAGAWLVKEDGAMKIFAVPSRRQGESICFDDQGRRLLLTSEFSPTPLISMACP